TPASTQNCHPDRSGPIFSFALPFGASGRGVEGSAFSALLCELCTLSDLCVIFISLPDRRYLIADNPLRLTYNLKLKTYYSIRHASSNSTLTIHNPCAGTVGPDFARSFASYNLSISPAVILPRPTSSSVPIIFLTMYRKNDRPCTVNHNSSPSSVRFNSVAKISRTIFRSRSSSSDPVEAANAAKSCTPTNRAAASFIASSSSGNG